MLRKAIFIWILLVVLISPTIATTSAQDTPPGRPQWDGSTRFTVLVLGIDRRPGGQHGLRYLSDVIMVVSINPHTNEVGILRLPRDLHLPREGSGDLERVNTLLGTGEDIQEGYGPYLVMDTIQYNLGIYIDAFILFDFDAFITIVDTIGGIEIDVPYTIRDDEFPDMDFGFDPLFLSAGRHVLDGYDALRYVRTRHSDNDFYRGERQMQVVMAIRDRIINGGAVPRLLTQAPTLIEELDGHVVTDLTLQEILFIAQYLIDIPLESIHTGGVDNEYIIDYRIPGGPRVYIPDRERITELMVSVFGERYWEP